MDASGHFLKTLMRLVMNHGVMARALLRLMSADGVVDPVNIDGPPSLRMSTLMSRWFSHAFSHLSHIEVEVELSATHLWLSTRLCIPLDDMDRDDRDSMMAAYVGWRRLFKRLADDPKTPKRVTGFMWNADAQLIVRRFPFARAIYELLCGFPAKSIDEHIQQRAYFAHMHSFVEAMGPVVCSASLARMASEYACGVVEMTHAGGELTRVALVGPPPEPDPSISYRGVNDTRRRRHDASGIEPQPPWLQIRARLFTIVAHLGMCRAQVQLAFRMLTGSLHIRATTHLHEHLRTLVDRIFGSHVERSVACDVPTVDLYIAALALLNDLFTAATTHPSDDTAAAATEPKHRLPGIAPDAILCAAVTLAVTPHRLFRRCMAERSVYKLAVEMCVANGAEAGEVAYTIPYLSPMQIHRTQCSSSATRSGKWNLDHLAFVLSVVRVLHDFPHAFDIHLPTWVYVAMCMRSGKVRCSYSLILILISRFVPHRGFEAQLETQGIDTSLMWDEYYMDVVNAFMGFAPHGAARDIAERLACSPPANIDEFREPHFKRVRDFDVAFENTRVRNDAAFRRELALVELVASSSRLEAFVSFGSHLATSADVEASWKFFKHVCNVHAIRLSWEDESETETRHVVYELGSRVWWCLPYEDYELYMHVMPLLQSTWLVPCIDSVLRLWDDPRFHGLILAWAARRAGLRPDIRMDVLAFEGSWIQSTIRAMMSADSPHGVLQALETLCNSVLPMSNPSVGGYGNEDGHRFVGSSLYDQADRSRALLRADSFPISRSGRHAHITSFFANIDGFSSESAVSSESSVVALPSRTTHAPLLILEAPRMYDGLPTSAEVFATLRLFTRLECIAEGGSTPTPSTHPNVVH